MVVTLVGCVASGSCSYRGRYPIKRSDVRFSSRRQGDVRLTIRETSFRDDEATSFGSLSACYSPTNDTAAGHGLRSQELRPYHRQCALYQSRLRCIS
ncbi:hypothetical protein [Bacteroides xylanisolvens]|uniref:hypothetical protein n=1 Tax=Bacteroides xylanisolvens TaxID=371601 RepID=UPI00193E37C6|nr:hypothetical protein [Bacteroides xylanisolvens]QRN00933.1 hypothetical protein GFH35_20980 [Bacteroides xylanisolvens]